MSQANFPCFIMPVADVAESFEEHYLLFAGVVNVSADVAYDGLGMAPDRENAQKK